MGTCVTYCSSCGYHCFEIFWRLIAYMWLEGDWRFISEAIGGWLGVIGLRPYSSKACVLLFPQNKSGFFHCFGRLYTKVVWPCFHPSTIAPQKKIWVLPLLWKAVYKGSMNALSSLDHCSPKKNIGSSPALESCIQGILTYIYIYIYIY